jgi:uncharacterized protein HemX
MFGILGKVIGPRVLLGLLAAAVLGLALMGYQLRVELAQNATHEANEAQYQAAIKGKDMALLRLRNEIQAQEKLLTEREDERQRNAEKLHTLKQKLEAVEPGDDSDAGLACLDHSVPDSVARILFQRENGDGTAD